MFCSSTNPLENFAKNVLCKLITENWGLADRIHIPKKKYSKYFEQCQLIWLLNIECRIFFSVLTKRITNFVLSNNFVNISTKTEIPGFSGCIEHEAMLWDNVYINKSAEFHVIGLDLWNVSGLFKYVLIEIKLCIPEDIRNLVSMYLKCMYIRFFNTWYATEWQKLDIVIWIICVISLLFF